MDTAPQDEPDRKDLRVRLDVVISAGILSVVIVGNLAWRVSDLDSLTALGTR